MSSAMLSSISAARFPSISSSSSSFPFKHPKRLRRFCVRRDNRFQTCFAEHREQGESAAIGVDVLNEFIQLNIGSWTGAFTQYDSQGNTLQHIPTCLDAHSYGRGDQVSLYQTLKIKQAPSKTFISGEDKNDEDEWAEFKLDETNLLTIDRKQQVGFFPKSRAYTISHRTAEMLDKVIRCGVLGDDGDDLDEAPPGVKFPSRRPALVCESCLYSDDEKNRLRAFHVLDPRGLLDFIGVFDETKADVESNLHHQRIHQDVEGLDALVGSWSGQAVTRRTGIYGSTLVEEDTLVTFKLEDNGNLIQEIKQSKGRVQLAGKSYGSVVKFDKGLQMTFLPGGMALVSPINVGSAVNRSQAFYFEFSWLYSPGKRRRLVRTYDSDGVVVSSTLINEIKL